MATDGKITAILIIEVMGRPKEHLVETLEKMAENMEKVEKVKIIEKKISEPKNVKDKEDVFSTFMEIEVGVTTLKDLSNLVFSYLPAHVEIVDPENLRFSNNDASDLLTGITQKLHKYDEVAKVLQLQNNILQNKLKSLGEKKD